ncbi:MAG: GntR family transcriptional regulator [Chloroflexota bacterium]
MARWFVDALDARTPRYLRIYRSLKRRIAMGELAAGSRLPPQRELSREFDVTPMTLRQALQLLEQEGLLLSRHGSGTYVTAQLFSYDMGHLRSFAQEMAGQGVDLVTRVLSARFQRVSPLVADRLCLGEGEQVYTLERLRVIAGRPVVYQRSYLPDRVGQRLAGMDLADRSLYDVLREDLHLRVVRARETIHPIVLASREADLLEEPKGTPAVISTRLSFTVGDRPILYDQAYMPGDRLAISADRVNDNLEFRYELVSHAAG